MYWLPRLFSIQRWHCTALYGCQLTLLVSLAAATSSTDVCWPTVHLRDATESPSDEGSDSEAGMPMVLWIRGLPCTRDDYCCSVQIPVRQGARTMRSSHEYTLKRAECTDSRSQAICGSINLWADSIQWPSLTSIDFAGHHAGPGLVHFGEPGLARIRHGHNVAFLASMPWRAMHIERVLLASCESQVEAATLSVVLPSAKLFCLRPVSNQHHEASTENLHQGARLQPGRVELAMLMRVHHENPSDAEQHVSTPEWGRLHTDLKHVWPSSISKGFDIVIIPAEGRELLFSLDSALLHRSQMMISEGLIDPSFIWNNSMIQQQGLSGPHLHMHRSGWEIYAKQSLFSNKGMQVKAGSAGGQVKVALHIAAISHYQLSLQQHLSRLIFSGLYDIVEGIYCFILGPTDAEVETAAKFVQGFGLKIIVAGNKTEMSLYERFTLLGMRDYLQPDDIFLYMHTKGITHPADSVPMFDWVFYMHYFLVKHFSVCLSLMKEHFDVCGVDYHFPDLEKPWIPSEHYSGNFWWARASYYLSLPKTIGAEYLDPEMYIGLGKPRYAALWESSLDASEDIYKKVYPPLNYLDTAADVLTLSH